MMKVKPTIAIVTDSTSDIPVQEAEALDITVVPALLTIRGRTYLDGKDITREDFYQSLPSMPVPPTTAVPSTHSFEETYRMLFSQGIEQILSIHLSPKLSGMFNVATQAAKVFGDKVHIFDSRQVSLGLGFQAMEAASAALAGLSFNAILESLCKVREGVRLIAMINNQEYLKRSGRVSWVHAGIGDLLRIKLLVEVIDGLVERRNLVRTRSKAIEHLVSLARSWGPLKRLAVLHTAIPEEAAAFAERIRHLSSSPPMIVNVTTLIGAHVGPACLGIAGLCQEALA
jgi:DegV family protein with EDD domain